MCLAQGHNAVPPVRLEPATLQSQVKNFTTEPLRSLSLVEYTASMKLTICKFQNYDAVLS